MAHVACENTGHPQAAAEQHTQYSLGVRRSIGLFAACIFLILLIVLSLSVGSKNIPLDQVWRLIFHRDESLDSIVIHDQRVPRTLVLIAVGAALGVAGTLMQSLTRNPLADPGILGVNAGASLAVVLSVAIWGITSIWFYLWFAFAGAAIASIAVYFLGQAGKHGTTPARLALAGVAISMAISAFVQTVILSNQNAFNEFRLWAAGSVEGRGYPIFAAVIGFIVIGLLIATACGPVLNVLALGEDTAKALGARIVQARVFVMIAIMILAGAATAAVGPITFIGLGVPYIARAICGPDQRWVQPFSMIAAPIVLLAADILARIIVPQEVPVGIMSAILGGPVFIAIVRRRRIEAL